MGRINVGRVIAGGLVAGLVINISESILNLAVVAQDMEAALRDHNLPLIGNAAIIQFVIMAFVLGIASVWLYAAIRPRFGAGMGTAVIAGLAVWVLAYFYSGIGMIIMQMFPTRLMIITLVWGLAEVVIGTVAGASVYQE